MKKLVVIDDEFIVVEGIKAMIARMALDYEVVGHACDGITALDVITQTRPDVVITDIRIPGMDGLSLIEAARELLPDTVYIVISGYQEFEYARRALHLGVRSYIDKPITIPKLSEILGKIESEKVTESQEKERIVSLDSLSERMIRHIREKSVTHVREDFHDIMAYLQNQQISLEAYKGEVYKMVCVAIGIFYEERPDFEREKHFPSFKNLEILNSQAEADSYVTALIERMLEKMELEKSGSTHQTIGRILDYISENYHKDIGLNELADMVHLNPAYLSILFKEEVGTSYIKYLTKVRLDHARQLLCCNHIRTT